MTEQMTIEEKWDFAESIFAGEQKEEVRRMRDEETTEVGQEPEPDTYASKRVYSLRFYAENGKAIAEAIFGSESHKVEVKSREHAVKIAQRAVKRANDDGAAIDFFHGLEVDSPNPFAPQFKAICLSAAAYEEVWVELEAAKHNSLWKITW